MSQNTLSDILNGYLEQYGWRREFSLCPEKWRGYTTLHTWQGEKLDTTKTGQIPDTSGIYTLILKPGIADHPACSYLMYVGKTKSLRVRFRKYLTSEKRATGRPKIFVFLNLYDNYIYFYYIPISVENLDTLEDALISAYLPPLNSEVKGTIGKSVRAWT